MIANNIDRGRWGGDYFQRCTQQHIVRHSAYEQGVPVKLASQQKHSYVRLLLRTLLIVSNVADVVSPLNNGSDFFGLIKQPYIYPPNQRLECALTWGGNINCWLSEIYCSYPGDIKWELQRAYVQHKNATFLRRVRKKVTGHDLAPATDAPARLLDHPSSLLSAFMGLSTLFYQTLHALHTWQPLALPTASALNTNESGVVYWQGKTNQAQKLHLYYQRHRTYPHINIEARRELQNAIKKSTGLEIDPDDTYYHHFRAAINDANAFTGWCHDSADLIESLTLTECVLHNFPADAQDNLDIVDLLAGIYKVDGDFKGVYGRENEIALKPSTLVNIVWDLDFYNAYRSKLTEYWHQPDDQEVINTYDFIFSMAKIRQRYAKKMQREIMNAYGVGPGINKKTDIYFFDINGYQATDLIIFERKDAVLKYVIYMPKARKLTGFKTLDGFKSWFIKSCKNKKMKRSFAAHFSLYNRQNGFFYYGIDSWLNTFSDDTMAESYRHKIWLNRDKVSGELSEIVLNRQEERTFSDADILIKSDAEVRRDMITRYVAAADYLLPNPYTPFILLGLDIDKAIAGDDADERSQGYSAVLRDGINILFMALTEALESKALAKAEFEPALTENGHRESITQQVRNNVKRRHRQLRARLNNRHNTFFQGPIRAGHDPFAARIDIHPGVVEKIRVKGIQGIKSIPIFGVDERGLTLSNKGKTYLKVDDGYYELTGGVSKDHYLLSENKDIQIFYDEEARLYSLSSDKKKWLKVLDSLSLIAGQNVPIP